jgi:hypothetical protein
MRLCAPSLVLGTAFPPNALPYFRQQRGTADTAAAGGGSRLVRHELADGRAVDGARHDVSDLLPQPGGFEGFGTVREPLVANDSSLPECDDDPVVELDLYAACPSAHRTPPVDQNLVGPRIHELGVPQREAARTPRRP